MKLSTIILCEMFHHHEDFSKYQVPLIGLAGIIFGGILTGIIPQMIIWYRENKNIKSQLINDERRISFLIERHYYFLIYHVLESTRYSRLSNISAKEGNQEHKNVYYQNSLLYSKKVEETQNEISLAISEYLKTVTHYVSITNKKINIEKEIMLVLDFNLEQYYSEFEEITDEKILNKQIDEEKENLNTHLKNTLVNYFNAIRKHIN